jgi:hypothetical protein
MSFAYPRRRHDPNPHPHPGRTRPPHLRHRSPEVPPGEHEVTITLATSPARETPPKKFRIEDLPKHDLGPWPEGLSVRREDIYDEDGR